MKKIIILLVAIVTCFTALFTGCGDSTGFNNKLTISASDAVSSNGGFAVVKGDYVYFINGVETYTADNKYGDVVKVYSMGEYSCEICGGPHAKNTGDLGTFKIVKEQSSSAGVRRIKAVLTK